MLVVWKEKLLQKLVDPQQSRPGDKHPVGVDGDIAGLAEPVQGRCEAAEDVGGEFFAEVGPIEAPRFICRITSRTSFSSSVMHRARWMGSSCRLRRSK